MITPRIPVRGTGTRGPRTSPPGTGSDTGWRRHDATAHGPPDGDRRLVPAPGVGDVAHARRRRDHLRRPPAGARARDRRAARTAAPRPALPPEARLPPGLERPPAVGRRPRLQPRVPRPSDRAALAGLRGAAVQPRLADLLPAARPLQAAVGA